MSDKTKEQFDKDKRDAAYGVVDFVGRAIKGFFIVVGICIVIVVVGLGSA
jgi:hypothetical protein